MMLLDEIEGTRGRKWLDPRLHHEGREEKEDFQCFIIPFFVTRVVKHYKRDAQQFERIAISAANQAGCSE
jgi:hypothetical protein